MEDLHGRGGAGVHEGPPEDVGERRALRGAHGSGEWAGGRRRGSLRGDGGGWELPPSGLSPLCVSRYRRRLPGAVTISPPPGDFLFREWFRRREGGRPGRPLPPTTAGRRCPLAAGTRPRGARGPSLPENHQPSPSPNPSSCRNGFSAM